MRPTSFEDARDTYYVQSTHNEETQTPLRKSVHYSSRIEQLSACKPVFNTCRKHAKNTAYPRRSMSTGRRNVSSLVAVSIST